MIIDSRMNQLAEQLYKKGDTARTMDYDAASTFAGCVRCSYHPVIHEPD